MKMASGGSRSSERRGVLTRLAAVLVMLAGFVGCASAGEEVAGGLYRGRVVDAVTKQPLAGGIVSFVWTRTVEMPGRPHLTEELHGVAEVTTDANGRFRVRAPSARGRAIVDVHLEGPLVFVPGYFFAYKARKEGTDFVIPLTKADDPKEPLLLRELTIDFRFGWTPKLLAAINAERARFGLPNVPLRKDSR